VFHNIERTIEEQIITRFSFKKQRKLRGQYFHPLRAKTKKNFSLSDKSSAIGSNGDRLE